MPIGSRSRQHVPLNVAASVVPPYSSPRCRDCCSSHISKFILTRLANINMPVRCIVICLPLCLKLLFLGIRGLELYLRILCVDMSVSTIRMVNTQSWRSYLQTQPTSFPIIPCLFWLIVKLHQICFAMLLFASSR